MALYNVRDEDQDSSNDVTVFFSENQKEDVTYHKGQSRFYLQDKDEDIVEYSIEDLKYLIKALQKLQEVIEE